jgi:hypothetical protein
MEWDQKLLYCPKQPKHVEWYHRFVLIYLILLSMSIYILHPNILVIF